MDGLSTHHAFAQDGTIVEHLHDPGARYGRKDARRLFKSFLARNELVDSPSA